MSFSYDMFHNNLPERPEQTQRILGIDPGLAKTGWGIIERTGSHTRCLDFGCIKTLAEEKHEKRLSGIYREISAIIKKWKPLAGAIETLYFAKNAKTAMPVGEARGVLCLAMAETGLSVFEYSPNVIKKSITGAGSADKKQIQEMVRLILGLEEIPYPDHAADALGAAICCANTETTLVLP